MYQVAVIGVTFCVIFIYCFAVIYIPLIGMDVNVVECNLWKKAFLMRYGMSDAKAAIFFISLFNSDVSYSLVENYLLYW